MQQILRQSLDTLLQEALNQPQYARIIELWPQVEEKLSALPDAEQLQIAGNTINRLAEIVVAKTEQIVEEWEKPLRAVETPTEPILALDDLQEFLRQTLTMNLGDLVIEPPVRTRTPSEPLPAAVEELPLSEALAIADQAEAYEKAIATAHGENISGWAAAIDIYLDKHGTPISLVELQQGICMPFIEVWLGLLLGETKYQMEAGEGADFYHSSKMVVKK